MKILVRISRFFAAWLFPALLASGCGTRSGGEPSLPLAMQSYTFHRLPLGEAMERTQELGIRYMEVFAGHPLGGGFGDRTFGWGMDSAEREAVREMAADHGIRIVAMGVVVPGSREEWPQVFRFAREMGIGTITCEPDPADWDLVERLSRESGVAVAVHNHPRPSAYWTPDSLLRCIAQRGPSLGACADIGHWSREGLDPAECLRKLAGRVKVLHFKDIAPAREGVAMQPDTVWGTGVLDLKGILGELRAQRFDGYLSVEYEADGDVLSGIRQSMRNYQSAFEKREQ